MNPEDHAEEHTGPQVLGRTAMVDWSDRDDGRPATGGPALVDFLRARSDLLGGHLLVAGPHDDAVLDLLVDTARSVTLVVRGSTDADAATDRYAGRPVTVVCGDLSDLGPAGVTDVDAVVLLDGLGRITSVESAPDTWPERLAAARAVAVEGAPVLVRVDNPLSVHALAQVPGPRSRDTDADWAGHDPGAPATAEQARAALPGSAVWSAFGPVAAPALLCPTGLAAAGTGAAAVAVSVTGTGGRIDERSALRRAADAGRIDDFAPAWLLAPGPATDDGLGSLPAGTLFEEAFLDAAARRDIGAARTLLRTAAEMVSDIPTTPTAVVVGATGACTRLPLATEGTPAKDDEALTDFCVALADRLVQLGVRHPWPAAADRAELARLFLAATDRDVPAAAIAARLAPLPVSQPEAITAVQLQTDAVRDRERAFHALLEVAETRTAQLTEVVERRGELIEQMRANLEKARANVQRLRAAKVEVDEIRSSRAYRLGRALTSPARLVRRT